MQPEWHSAEQMVSFHAKEEAKTLCSAARYVRCCNAASGGAPLGASHRSHHVETSKKVALVI